MEDDPDYCFVVCCERSGSSAFIRLLHAHDGVVMGLERYRLRYRLFGQGKALTVDRHHFRPDRFFDFRPDDTKACPPRFVEHYDRARQRFASGQVQVVGDKLLPPDRRLAPAMAARFPAARFILIYRDPLAVAASFQRKAEDPDSRWPERNDHKEAVLRWNELAASLGPLCEVVDPGRVMTISTDRLFGGGNAHSLEALLGFLELERTGRLEHRYRRSVKRWRELAREARPLTVSQTDWAQRQIDWSAWNRLQNASDASLARFGAARPNPDEREHAEGDDFERPPTPGDETACLDQRLASEPDSSDRRSSAS